MKFWYLIDSSDICRPTNHKYKPQRVLTIIQGVLVEKSLASTGMPWEAS